jgi:hypothetical protein
MSDKKSITFRCDADILEALDYLGRERYHAKTPPGYDRSKILMDILRLNIEVLSDGPIVLLGTVEVRQSASDNSEERITEILKASGAIEQIRVEVKAVQGATSAPEPLQANVFARSTRLKNFGLLTK